MVAAECRGALDGSILAESYKLKCMYTGTYILCTYMYIHVIITQGSVVEFDIICMAIVLHLYTN